MKKWCFFVLMCSVHIGGASEYRGSILLWPRTKRSLFHQIPFSLKFSFGKISMGYRNLKVPEVTTIATLGWSSDHETNALARALRAGTAMMEQARSCYWLLAGWKRENWRSGDWRSVDFIDLEPPERPRRL